jgi:adenylate cyclase
MGKSALWRARNASTEVWSGTLFAKLLSTATRRHFRMASGLILFGYIGAHLINHSLGLISLHAAESGMEIAIEVWYSLPGTVLLYGAAATHFFLALWSVYERRTFWLPPAELIRIALGFTLPILLIGHAAATRLAYEMFGLSSDYTRVISNIWASEAQGWQLGLMAPGWLHGCLGLHFAFSRRPLYRKLRFVLFGAAVLLPVLSALGFIAMGRELATSPAAAAAALEYLSPNNAAQRLAISEWKNGLLNAYFSIIGAAFIAREIRNLFERRRRGLVSVSYPGQTVRVPRGWSVLEASRSFHIPHASMCGGRARCSTCRVRVTAGEEFCPAPEADEQATLARIGASDDMRLACQLRPQGDISVIPLVETARPIYRQTVPTPSGEREIVVLFCDFRNRATLAGEHLHQDMMYILTLYFEAVANVIRSNGGTLSYLEFDSTCALFGLHGRPSRAAQQALQAAGGIEGVIADLNNRLGRQSDNRIRFSVSIHAARAVIGEIGLSDPPAVIAVGEAMDVANELRKAAAAHDKPFAISRQVFAAAGIEPNVQQEIKLGAPGRDAPCTAYLSESAPISLSSWTIHGEQNRRTILRRLWTG